MPFIRVSVYDLWQLAVWTNANWMCFIFKFMPLTNCVIQNQKATWFHQHCTWHLSVTKDFGASIRNSCFFGVVLFSFAILGIGFTVAIILLQGIWCMLGTCKYGEYLLLSKFCCRTFLSQFLSKPYPRKFWQLLSGTVQIFVTWPQLLTNFGLNAISWPNNQTSLKNCN